LSFFCDHSLAEIGAVLGVTESRACQLRKAALGKLRKAISDGERPRVGVEAPYEQSTHAESVLLEQRNRLAIEGAGRSARRH
jgi:sigma-70-like protein